MKKKRNFKKKIVIFILILILIFGVIYFICDKSSIDKNITDPNTKIDKNITDDKKDDEDKNEEKDENKIDDDSKTSDDNVEESKIPINKDEANENKSQVEVKNLNVSNIELIGDEEIVLNVGDKYNELGAKAYNTDGKDISSEIKIDSSVDTSKQGKYTVSYSIGNWIVMRYVIVK